MCIVKLGAVVLALSLFPLPNYTPTKESNSSAYLVEPYLEANAYISPSIRRSAEIQGIIWRLLDKQ